ncbi:MAG TPA: tetratricopeptide repeat protein [Blastocatellia bacterium]|nr:tetratricopeptide repeat protein [Blastocatellia bacterium]
MARAGKKKGRVRIKDIKYSHDPMIRLYYVTQDWLQERGRPILIGIGIVAGLVALYVVGNYFFSARADKAGAAFTQALEKFNAQVTDTPPVDQPGKFYSDEKVKWQEASEAFERVAADYPGYYGAIGRYYAGVAYLHFDRDKGLAMLGQVVEKKEQPACDFAELALAENYAANGETDKAIPLYEKLAASAYVPATAVNLGRARAYEKTGDTQKAVEAYVEVAREGSTSPAWEEAKKRLTALAPERLKELPPPESAIPR